ncbi:MAG: relaxase domain-containing protein [Gemmatimonadaceae bacterium]|nr:relaxase domain-containing protein [Gemmatimonadaceae bacterium]
MLSIHPVGASAEQYFLREGPESYYLKGGDALGHWGGEAARALHLSGRVSGARLAHVLDGRSPDGRSALVQIQRYTDGRARQRGWDLTFSAPKSASILWAIADAETGASIVSAHDSAVAAAMARVQSTAAFTRRTQGRVESAKLLWAQFRHGASRSQDPQLHTHVVVANTCLRMDGTWGTLRSRDIYEYKLKAGQAYREELARILQQTLGLTLAPASVGFHIVGLPDSLIKAFSSRRKAIEADLVGRGVTGALEAARSALRTRPRKTAKTIAELREHWIEVGAAHGFGPEHARHLVFGRVQPHTVNGSATVHNSAERPMSREQRTDITPFVVVDDPSLRTVRRSVHATEPEAQTDRTLRAEAARHRDTSGELELDEPTRKLTGDHLSRAIARLLSGVSEYGAHWTGGRLPLRASSRHWSEWTPARYFATPNRRRVSCLVGLAGSGKTRVIADLCHHWTKSGYRLIGAAPTPVGAATLQRETGIKSYTCAALLRGFPDVRANLRHHVTQLVRTARGRKTYHRPHIKLDSRTVLVIEHAELASASTLKSILARCARARARLVLSGDDTEIFTAGNRNAFGRLVEMLGAARLPEQYRFVDETTALVTISLSLGDTSKALARIADARRLAILSSHAEAMNGLLADWRRNRTPDIARTLVVTGEEDDRTDANASIQRMRRASSELGRLHVRHKGCRFYVNDRVFVEHARVDSQLIKGEFGTVTRLDGLLGRPSMHVRLDRRSRGWLGSSHVHVRIPLTRHSYVRLGYAQTATDCDGLTLDRVLVLGGSWLRNYRKAYCALSRARETPWVYLGGRIAGVEIPDPASVTNPGTDIARRQAGVSHDAISHGA